MSADNFDFAVVGGGVAGLMTACELSKAGAAVAVLDAGYPPASAAGAGILSALPPWKYNAHINALIDESSKHFGSIAHEIEAAGGGDCEWRRSGMLAVGGNLPAAPPGGTATPVRWLAPLLALPPNQYGIWMPEVARVRASVFVSGLATMAKNRGVRFFGGAAGFAVGGGKVKNLLLADGKKLSAGDYILCAGALSGELCPPPAPPITPARGQLLLYASPKPLLCIVFADGADEGLYLVPRNDDAIIAGASFEHAGFDDRPAAAVQDALHKKAAALFPPLADAQILNSWSGLRPMLPDDMPVIGAHPECGNLYLNTGHGRYGISMAPAAARHLLKIMKDKTAENPFAFRAEWAE
ncbi:MAG: NAD(P)/FAD-dependent oxidoreductase [Gammaproteobacteria bacterium]